MHLRVGREEGCCFCPDAVNKLYLVSGDFVEADKYALATIIIDDVKLLPLEVVLIVDEFEGK